MTYEEIGSTTKVKVMTDLLSIFDLLILLVCFLIMYLQKFFPEYLPFFILFSSYY